MSDALSTTRRVPVLAALGMVALGLVVETVILVVVAMVYEPQGAKGPFSLLELLHGGFVVRAVAMGGLVAGVAFAAPAFARTFAAGPLLGFAAWAVGIAVDGWLHSSLQAAGVSLLVGGLPALFVGSTMPMFVRRMESA